MNSSKIIKILYLFALYSLDLGAQTIDENALKKLAETQVINNGATSLETRNLDDGRDKSIDDSTETLIGDDIPNIFGFSYLNKVPKSISATSDLPVPNDYRISLNDIFEIILSGNKVASYDIKVGLDGKILIPEIGSVLVVGKSINDVEINLQDRIDSIFVGVDIDLSLKTLNARKITITGAVKVPGTYIVNPFSTISNVLAYSGGLEEYASLRNITLVRGSEKIYFDLYDLLIDGDRSNDLNLQSGDTIVVPATSKQVELEGEVNRPMIYEYKSTDTFGDLIKYALGSTLKATNDDFYVLEKKGGQIISSKIKLTDRILDRNIESLYINAIAEVKDVGISVKGSGVSESFYSNDEFSKLSDLINILSFSSDIYPFYGVLRQTSGKGLIVERKSFSLLDANSYKDFTLKDNVELQFFSKSEIEEWQNGFKKLLGLNQDDDKNKNSIKKFTSQNLAKISEDKLQTSFNATSSIEEISNRIELLEKDFGDIKKSYNSENDRELERKKLEEKEDLALEEFEKNRESFFQSDLKLVYFGEKEMILPISGQVVAKTIFDYFGFSVNILSDNTSVITVNGLTENAYQTPVNAVEILQINFPQEKQKRFEVEIKGQVKNPGKYIVSNSSSLNDLYELAGGVTNRAALEAIIFSRESIKRLEEKALEKSRAVISEAVLNQISNPLSTANVDVSSLLGLLELAENIEFGGRLTGDIMPGSDLASSIFLETGDVITVPSALSTISVVGEVLQPITTVFNSNTTIEEYIDLAGGLNDSSDKGQIYIIKANGISVPYNRKYFTNKIYPDPGDTIVVPRNIEKLPTVSLVSVATRVISDIAFASASLNAINN